MNSTLQIAKLTRNPFTLVPATEVSVWAGYELLKNQLLDIVISCRSDRVGLSEFTILHGDYGTGKSHSLRYLQHLITKREPDEFQSPCVYLETLKVASAMNFVALYRKIMDLLIAHIQETAVWLDLAVEETAKNASSGSQRFQETVDNIYRDPQLTPGFPALGLLLRGINNGAPASLDLLLGGKLSGSGVMEKYLSFGMTGPIESEYDATRCLGAYVNLCTQGSSILNANEVVSRNKAFYFFVDELETVADFRPQEALSINQGIRDLINACPENCCFLFGMTADVRDIYGFLSTAVIRRMSREPLAIEPLTSDDAVDFLKQVLKGHRVDPNDPDEYPFQVDALAAIAEATQRKTPSELFRACRRVLEKCVLSGDLSSGGMIDVEMVKKNL